MTYFPLVEALKEECFVIQNLFIFFKKLEEICSVCMEFCENLEYPFLHGSVCDIVAVILETIYN